MPKIDVLNSPQAPSAPLEAPKGKLGLHAISKEEADPRIPKPSIAISATPSAENSFVYLYTKETMTWGGKTYRLTLEVPLEQPRSSYTESELESAAKAFAKEFLKDLKKRLETQSPILPGQNFKVLFDSDGYIAFTPKGAPNYTKEGVQSGPHIAAFDERGRELSQIIELKSPSAILKRLQPVKPPPSFTAIGLVNSGVCCFANTAFQQWITNPLIRKELHASYFVDGEKNPLYIALTEYLKHSRENRGPYNLTPLLKALKIDDKTQQDTDEAFKKFNAQLSFFEIPPKSLLRSQIVKTLTKKEGSQEDVLEDPAVASRCVILQPNQTLADLLKARVEEETPTHKTVLKQKERFSSPPAILTVYANRKKCEFKNSVYRVTGIDTTPIKISSLEIELPAEVCGKTAKYELMSYSFHLGGVDAGHWVAYIREDSLFFRISDSVKTPITEKEFLDSAQQGVSFVLNHKGS